MERLTLDSKNTLVNVGNSILGFFNVPKFHDSYEPLDKILKETKKTKLALILLDGMGKVIFETYKEDIPFLYSHIFKEYKTVFPPTTVAATTALTTGKYPIETGYLGWTQYFKSKKAYINVFPSADAFDHEKRYTPPVTIDELQVDKLWDLINKTLKFNATNISSFETKIPGGEDDFESFFAKASKLVSEHDFVYIYSSNPDHLLHEHGIKNEVIRKNLIYLDSKVKELVESHADTLFLLTADHGFSDIEEISITEYPDFVATLKEPLFSIEPRFATVSVKNDEQFLKLANEYYGDYFIIKSKDEIIKENTFGYGEPHPNALDSIKDYILIAKDKYAFNQSTGAIGFKGSHAGVKSIETDIYLLIFNS